MNETTKPFAVGGCTCGHVRYQLLTSPLFVHCCHCSWCQRETGSAFALNALIEADRVELITGTTQSIDLATQSGKGQKITRCSECQIALWSNYAGAGEQLHFIRVGTLEDPDRLPPDIHIFTSTKLPWVQLEGNVPIVEGYYSSKQYWSGESLERRQRLRANSN